MMRHENVCPTCGQSLGTRYCVTKGLRDAIRLMSSFIESKGFNAVHLIKEMVNVGILTANQERNLITHGIRTGLIAHIKDNPGNYCITARGYDFLGDNPVPKYAYAVKHTKAIGTRTVRTSEETCRASDFNRSGEYWEGPGYEIREGHVIKV